MKEEKHSIFDQFETDEETGEVIIPRAPVGVVRDPEPEKKAPERKTPKKGENGAKEDAAAEAPKAEKEPETDGNGDAEAAKAEEKAGAGRNPKNTSTGKRRNRKKRGQKRVAEAKEEAAAEIEENADGKAAEAVVVEEMDGNGEEAAKSEAEEAIVVEELETDGEAEVAEPDGAGNVEAPEAEEAIVVEVLEPDGEAEVAEPDGAGNVEAPEAEEAVVVEELETDGEAEVAEAAEPDGAGDAEAPEAEEAIVVEVLETDGDAEVAEAAEPDGEEADGEEEEADGEEEEPEEDDEGAEGVASMDEDGLPVIDLDLNFTEEDLVEVKESEDEDEDSMLKSIDAALEQEMAFALGDGVEEPEQEEKKKNFWTKLPLWLRITGVSVASLFLIVALVIGTKPGRKIVYKLMAGYIWGRVEHPSEGLTPELPRPTEIAEHPTEELTPGIEDPDLTPGIEDPELTPPPITPPPPGAPRQEDYCYNILLIGVEALEYFGSGERSDSMIILSINKRDKKIRLTSLMRDMLVSINGYPDNRLNAAYAKGGAPLLVDTIERNLKVKIDDYVKVNFDNFEWIIDRLGGVEITLTEREASYLRTTRYITNPAYRNVVAGTQLMNGNQVLGYCRVRKVPTASGTDSDFGRTERQRTVLTKLFNKYKEKNIWTLIGILNDCLPKVTTSMSKDTMSELLEMVVEERILTMETKRIPVAGSYQNVDYLITGDTRTSQVLVIRWPQNIEALQEFIFGTGKEGE